MRFHVVKSRNSFADLEENSLQPLQLSVCVTHTNLKPPNYVPIAFFFVGRRFLNTMEITLGVEAKSYSSSNNAEDNVNVVTMVTDSTSSTS